MNVVLISTILSIKQISLKVTNADLLIKDLKLADLLPDYSHFEKPIQINKDRYNIIPNTFNYKHSWDFCCFGMYFYLKRILEGKYC